MRYLYQVSVGIEDTKEGERCMVCGVYGERIPSRRV